MTALSDRERLLRTVPERAWTSQVIEIARKTGWICHHSRTAIMRSGRWATPLQGLPGLPDLILVRAGRCIFAELKRQQGGGISFHQQVWLEELRRVPGVEVYVWKPSDVDQVIETLQRGQA